jgi:hypothetical protein
LEEMMAVGVMSVTVVAESSSIESFGKEVPRYQLLTLCGTLPGLLKARRMLKAGKWPRASNYGARKDPDHRNKLPLLMDLPVFDRI